MACPGKSEGFQYCPVAVFEENQTALWANRVQKSSTSSFMTHVHNFCNILQDFFLLFCFSLLPARYVAVTVCPSASFSFNALNQKMS